MDLRFGGLFGRVWGGFWETKILDFRIFVDVFSKSFLKRVPEGDKVDQKCEKTKLFRFLVVGLRCTGRAWGGIIGRGNMKISRDTCNKTIRCWCLVFDVEVDDIGLARRWHTFGGRRIEDPRGGITAAHPPSGNRG